MKWEDKFKETLEKRTIKPSDASWNALADQLDAEERHNYNNNKAMYWWMGIAAGLIAIMFTVSLFFNNSSTEIQQSVVVDAQEEVIENPVPQQVLPERKQVVEGSEKSKTVEHVEEYTDKKEHSKKQNSFTSPIKLSQSLAKTKTIEPLKPLEVVTQSQTLEAERVSEIIAQIHSLKDRGETVSDADIDALLDKAQKEIAYQSILMESTRTVDANALLQDVESDLQRSFRTKILEALMSSYETLKTSVAERHN